MRIRCTWMRYSLDYINRTSLVSSMPVCRRYRMRFKGESKRLPASKFVTSSRRASPDELL